MEEAAQLLVGEHDFRNFCRLDGSKQILNHSRRVIKTWFDVDDPSGIGNGMVVFNLIGSAFLWHQVRHIIGVLFLIGSKLEPPSLVSELLDVSKNSSRPSYQMGYPLPLTLHSCAYPEEDLEWRLSGYDGDTSNFTDEEKAEESLTRESLERQLVAVSQEAEIRAWQVGGGLRKMREVFGPLGRVGRREVVLHPMGGGEVSSTMRYQHVMDRPRGETPDEMNRRWREKKGRAGPKIRDEDVEME